MQGSQRFTLGGESASGECGKGETIEAGRVRRYRRLAKGRAILGVDAARPSSRAFRDGSLLDFGKPGEVPHRLD